MIIEIIGPWLIGIIGIIIILPFYRLAERKIIGYIQCRKGPNKVGILGLLQPVRDGIKLIIKENKFLWERKKIIFYLLPIIRFLVMLRMAMVSGKRKFYTFRFLIILAMVRVSSIRFLGLAWARNSKYRNLGAVRIIRQVIRYELRLLGVLLLVFNEVSGASLNIVKSYPRDNIMLVVIILLLIIFAIEAHRIPFDFAEGERELVSGFNVEYASLLFALIRLREYGSMVIRSIIVGFFFKNWVLQLVVIRSVMFYFLWLRGTFPRYRYDLLMEWGWVYLLPLVFIIMWIVFL